MTDRIKIVQIQKDRKQCIDTNGKIYNISDIDVLKVGHHGSKTSSGKDFIGEINPKYSVISVGKNNRYGHPNKEVLNNLNNSKIYRTDKQGSIMFKIKNNKLNIENCSPQKGVDMNYYNEIKNELGKGYSKRNLWLMLKFYELNEKVQTLSAQLSWSHYCELLSFENTDKINYYIELVKNNNLSVRQLRERIKFNEYERLYIETKNKLIFHNGFEVKDLVPNRNKNNIEIVTEKALHN